MCPTAAERVSELLLNWGRDDQNAREELIPLVYGELRRSARRSPWQEHLDHTLQNAALVREASLRFIHDKLPQRRHRAHFLGVAAHASLQRKIRHKEVRK